MKFTETPTTQQSTPSQRTIYIYGMRDFVSSTYKYTSMLLCMRISYVISIFTCTCVPEVRTSDWTCAPQRRTLPIAAGLVPLPPGATDKRSVNCLPFVVIVCVVRALGPLHAMPIWRRVRLPIAFHC